MLFFCTVMISAKTHIDVRERTRVRTITKPKVSLDNRDPVVPPPKLALLSTKEIIKFKRTRKKIPVNLQK